jgi:flagellar export protein FliJ
LREGEVLSLGVTRELHGFLGRLDQVQGIQRETIGRIELQLQAAQRAVAQCKQRLRMVELLLERRQSARRSMADRAEQREMDAIAARQMAARKGLAAMAWR